MEVASASGPGPPSADTPTAEDKGKGVPQDDGRNEAGGVGRKPAAAQGAGARGRGSPSPRMVLTDVVPKALEIHRRTVNLWAAHELKSRLNKAFNAMLERTYHRLQPSPADHSTRLHLLERLNNMIQPYAPGSQVVIFGSFETNVYTPSGDLDLSLVLPETGVVRFDREHVELKRGPVTKTQRVKILRIMRRVLSRAFSHMELVAGARVPVLNFVDGLTRVHCDMSINNDGAMFKSRVLRWVLELDERCRPLVYLVKAWARAHAINDSRSGTMNSYAISLLVVFHLQTRSPPILPPFEAILGKEYHELRKGIDVSELRVTEEQLSKCHGFVMKLKAEWVGKYGANSSTLGELLASFFTQYASVESLWPHGLTVSPWRGTWKEARQVHSDWYGKQYIMRVEDPFDLSENCARSVQPGRLGFVKVCTAFRSAAQLLRHPPTWGKIEEINVALFNGQVPLPNGDAYFGGLSAPPRLGGGSPVGGGQSHVAPGGGHQGAYRPPGMWRSGPGEGSHVSANGSMQQGGNVAPFYTPLPQENHVRAMLAALGGAPGPSSHPPFQPPSPQPPETSGSGSRPQQQGNPQVPSGSEAPTPHPSSAQASTPLLPNPPSSVQFPTYPAPHFPPHYPHYPNPRPPAPHQSHLYPQYPGPPPIFHHPPLGRIPPPRTPLRSTQVPRRMPLIQGRIHRVHFLLSNRLLIFSKAPPSSSRGVSMDTLFTPSAHSRPQKALPRGSGFESPVARQCRRRRELWNAPRPTTASGRPATVSAARMSGRARLTKRTSRNGGGL